MGLPILKPALDSYVSIYLISYISVQISPEHYSNTENTIQLNMMTVRQGKQRSRSGPWVGRIAQTLYDVYAGLTIRVSNFDFTCMAHVVVQNPLIIMRVTLSL